MLRGSPRLALLSLVGLAAVLRFPTLGMQSFGPDEAYTVILTRLPSLGDVFHQLPHTESTPPLHYALVWLWAQVFGTGEVGLRSLSALAGVLAVPVAYAAVRELLSPRAGLIAAAVIATNPLLVWFSQEARSYALLVLLAGVSFWAFAWALDRPSHGALAAWSLASALALATHYFAALVIVPEAAWLLLRVRARRRVLTAIAVPVATGLALIPLADEQRTQLGGAHVPSWAALQGDSLARRLAGVPREALVGFHVPAGKLLFGVSAAMVAFSLWLLYRRARPPARHQAMIVGSIVGFGMIVPVVAALADTKLDYIATRFFLPAAIPATAIVAGGFAVNRRGSVAAAALVAVSILATVAVPMDQRYQRPPIRDAARGLGTAREPRILLLTGEPPRALQAYALGIEPLPFSGWRVKEIDLVAIRFPGQEIAPRDVPTRPPASGFQLEAARRASGYVLLRYTATSPHLVQPVPMATRIFAPPFVTNSAVQHATVLIQFPRPDVND